MVLECEEVDLEEGESIYDIEIDEIIEIEIEEEDFDGKFDL